ncbi:MAG: ABC transporter permease [Candidatus Cloacimonetes bacterium]|nr:ABC transporter permease [Candidatus Cloacimonadota bacterium]
MHNPVSAIVRHKELLYTLTWRNIKVRYKQSFLGVGWAILQPFVTMVVFTVVFSKLLNVPSDDIPYPIFVYSAILPWSFFSKSISQSTNSLVSNVNLVTKIYFPREIIIYSIILANGFDFIIAATIYSVMMIYFNVSVNWNILFILLLIIIQIIMIVGVSLLTSAVNVKYRDVGYVLPFFLQLWMYACPIIYPISIIPDSYKIWYMINPMVGIIHSYRGILTQGKQPDFVNLGISILITAIIVILSYKYFKKAEAYFADII